MNKLSGVFTASVTPLKPNLSPDLPAMTRMMAFHAERGAHGVLLLGTTGEGPSFSPEERMAIFQAGAKIKSSHPDFILLAGTGTPSLDGTIRLNQAAFDLGFDGVVVLPPYYFRSASEDGLFDWFSQVVEDSIPAGKRLFGYHFPKISGVPLTPNLLARLADRHPVKFSGIKDSTGEWEHAQMSIENLPGQSILVGNDRLLTAGLEMGAAGSITALANIVSPLLREIYDRHLEGQSAPETQAKVDAARAILDELTPFPASIKGLMAELFDFPLWPVKPPLELFPADQIKSAARKLAQILN
jgi:4-hydroxy-tetrahydrodipicolinate synthase